METGTLRGFCTRQFQRLSADRLGAQGLALLVVGRAFGTVAEVTRRNPRALPSRELQRLVDATATAFQHRATAGVP